MPYKLKATFDKLNGKFTAVFQNSVIIDCHDLFPTFISALEISLKEIRISHPLKYAEAIILIDAVKLYLKESH